MKVNYFNIAVICILVIVFTSSSSGNEIKRRQKRYLRFIEGSKYFMRTVFKFNMIPEMRVFGQAGGFRINFEAPKKLRGTRHKISRRHLYQNLESIVEQHGLDGRSCILKALCEASRILTNQSGIMLKIFKRIFTYQDGDDLNYPCLKSRDCETLEETCPLSRFSLAKYTDD